MIVIKEDFTYEEILAMRKSGDSACTASNFRFIDFSGQTVKAGDKSKIAKYLLEKAVEQGGKKASNRKQSKKTD